LDALRLALAIPGARRLLSWMIRRNPIQWAHRNVHYWDESLKSLEEAHEYGDPPATAVGTPAFIQFLAETMHPAPVRQAAVPLRREQVLEIHPILGSKQGELVDALVLGRQVPAIYSIDVSEPDAAVERLMVVRMEGDEQVDHPAEAPRSEEVDSLDRASSVLV